MTGPKKPASVIVKRYELVIALASLLAALVATITSLIIQYRQVQRLDELQITIRDTNDLRESLRKPLEGLWEYKLEFAKYFGQESPYISTGKAIIIWQPTSNDYGVYIAYGVKQQWGVEEVVTGFLSGTLRTNGDGWPEEPFDLPMRYDHRTGKIGFEHVIRESFSFTGGAIQRDASKKRATQIVMTYDDKETTLGKVMLWR
jgi:hypothetical protein